MSRPLPRLYVVGAGHVGLGLALALKTRGQRLFGVWNRGHAGRQHALEALGQSIDGPPWSANMRAADIVLLAVSDDAIASVAQALHQAGHLLPGMVVGHLSGCLPAAAMGPMPGVAQGSMHPVVACPTAQLAAQALQGAHYTLEGDAAAVAMLTRVVDALQGKAARIASAHKARYHAAAVMASNLMVSLLAQAIDEGEAAGFDAAATAYRDLATGALAEVQRLGPEAALTGPVVRGDVQTVQQHLNVLGPQSREIYRRLSQRALKIAATRGLDAATLARLTALLETA